MVRRGRSVNCGDLAGSWLTPFRLNVDAFLRAQLPFTLRNLSLLLLIFVRRTVVVNFHRLGGIRLGLAIKEFAIRGTLLINKLLHFELRVDVINLTNDLRTLFAGNWCSVVITH